jgi:hypothetical protein
MLVYNTTYQVSNANARNFVIWINEVYIPKATDSEILKNPRLTRILSHKDEESECFSLQFEVEDSTVLHRWHTNCGSSLNDELTKLFDGDVVGFPTLMEVIL